MGYVEERIKLMAVEAWQKNQILHPLTCGTDGCQENLYPIIDVRGITVLRCHNDDYQQDFIPNPVIVAFLDRI